MTKQKKNALLFLTHRPFANPLAIAHLEEFKELVRAGGFINRGVVYQVLKKIEPATLIGSGKVEALKEKIKTSQAERIIFEHPLSGLQIRNLERELQILVMDRNQLILDIFAQRAKTHAGKLQVELACILDELPRMVGAWMSSLSRQRGGIGVKGPGEKAIETDRRQVKIRVKKIKKKLEKIRRVREGHRALRRKNKIPILALIGYTNSGKSSLLNALTDASVPVQDLPFMTLDPKTRKIYIPGVENVVITDTVGFIKNLSPHLIEAFKSTLEESASADILLHVIDLSSPLMKVQIETVNQLLVEFGWDHKPRIYVYNKMDIAPKEKVFQTNSYPRAFVSALKGVGLHQLKDSIAKEVVRLRTEEVELYFSKPEEEKIYYLSRKALIRKKEISSLGTICYACLGDKQMKEWEHFIVKKSL